MKKIEKMLKVIMKYMDMNIKIKAITNLNFQKET